MSKRPTVILKPREEDRLLRGHPWVYDNEIARVIGEAAPGAEVSLSSTKGAFLGSALYSPSSRIRARRYSHKDEAFDEAFIAGRLALARERRRASRDLERDSYRAVFAEADGLPGLIVDRYAEASGGRSYLSVQILARGLEERRAALLSALDGLYKPSGIIERSDAAVRELEGLAPGEGVIAGSVPEAFAIRENGLEFEVRLGAGQKTGWFLDQRENRAAAAVYAPGRRVLDLFCNQGGFALAAAARGAASALAVDASAEALAAARANASRNGLAEKLEAREADVFEFVRAEQKAGSRYGLIVLDPPAFAKSKAALEGATRGYKDLNLRALKLLEPGGVLATFSCSYWMSRERLLWALEAAAADARVELRYLEELGQAPDHPIVSGYAESRYLKGFIVEARPQA